MLKLIPSFSYIYALESDNAVKSLGILRDRFAAKGAVFKSDTDHDFVAEIHASQLAKAINMVPDTLKIHVQRIHDSNKIRIEVIRLGEKKGAIAFVCMASIISIAAFLQSRESKALLMPFLFYGFMWLYSVMLVHPAHKAIRDLARFTDET